MECFLAFLVPSDAAWQSVPFVADSAVEVVRCGCEVVEQCVAELPHLATVEIEDGGVCVLKCRG